jgi:hypothetical protein
MSSTASKVTISPLSKTLRLIPSGSGAVQVTAVRKSAKNAKESWLVQAVGHVSEPLNAKLRQFLWHVAITSE